ARAGPLEVRRVAADALVQPHELLGGDDAVVQRLEPVLHALVVDRLVALRVAVGVDERADHTGVVVGAIAADAIASGRRGGRVVREGGRPAGAAVALDARIAGIEERGDPRAAEPGVEVAVDGRALRQGEGRAVRR